MYSVVELALPGVSLVRSKFKEFIVDIYMLCKKKKKNPTPLEHACVQFSYIEKVGNSGITIKRHPVLDFALHSK